MMTAEDILTSSGRFPDRPLRWPPTMSMMADAAELSMRLSVFAKELGHGITLTSGYRPAMINADVPGAAKKSNHLLCRAADIKDPDGAIDAYCLAHLDVLERLGLWLEDPKYTPGWCHLQKVPPASGRRVFIP